MSRGNGLSVSANMEGLDGLLKEFRTLEAKTRRRAFRQVAQAGGRVLLKHMRRNVPVDTGALKKSLAMQVRFADQDGALVRVGVTKQWMAVVRRLPDGGSKTQMVRPAWYAHLTERDVKPHSLASKDARAREDRMLAGLSSQAAMHPGYRGRQWMARSVVTAETEMVGAMVRAAEKVLGQ